MIITSLPIKFMSKAKKSEDKGQSSLFDLYCSLLVYLIRTISSLDTMKEENMEGGILL